MGTYPWKNPSRRQPALTAAPNELKLPRRWAGNLAVLRRPYTVGRRRMLPTADPPNGPILLWFFNCNQGFASCY